MESYTTNQKVISGSQNFTNVTSFDCSLEIVRVLNLCENNNDNIIFRSSQFKIKRIINNSSEEENCMTQGHKPQNKISKEYQQNFTAQITIEKLYTGMYEFNKGINLEEWQVTYRFCTQNLTEIIIIFDTQGFSRERKVWLSLIINIFKSNKHNVDLLITPEIEVLHKHLLILLEKKTYDHIIIHMILNEIWNQATYAIMSNPKFQSNVFMTPYFSVIKRAKCFILEHFDKPILLQDVARNAWMSPFHLSRIFKILLNYSPYAYLMKVRLKNAQILLQTTDLTVADISLLSGFNRPDYFATAFAKEYGLPPTKYRRINFI